MHGTEFSELKAFILVAERVNFARAAAQLGVAPSTISQTIRSLEERLGMRLLNRTTRKVSLTDMGERLLARIRPAILEIDAAVEDLKEVRDIPTGTLRLSVSSIAAQIVLAPVLKGFLSQYPAIALDISIDDVSSDIVGGRFDAGIRVGRAVAKDMQIVRLTEPSRLIAFAAPAYLKGNPAPKVPEDLAHHNCIRYRKDAQVMAWEFTKGKRTMEMSVTGTLTTNSMSLMMQAVRDGIGVGYTIESCIAADIAAGRLTPLLMDWSPGHHSYYLYHSGRRQLPAPLKAFIAYLRSSQNIGKD